MGLFGKLLKGNKEAKDKHKKQEKFKVSGIELDNHYNNRQVPPNILQQMEKMGLNPYSTPGGSFSD